MTSAERWKLYYAANRERLLAARKSPEAKERQKINQRRWYTKNIEHTRRLKREANRRWVDANRDTFREGCKRHREANPEKVAAHKKKWAVENADHLKTKGKEYREKNADIIREKKRAYQKQNPGKFASRNAKRRALKRKAAVGTDRTSHAAFCSSIKSAASARCYWCNKLVPRGRRHIDHIVPLIRGGVDSVENLCCACDKCNLRKNKQLPETFSGQLQLL